MNISELTRVSYEIVKVLRDNRCTADDAATCLLLALGQLTARHAEEATARDAFDRVLRDSATFRVFELAWTLQRQQQRTIII